MSKRPGGELATRPLHFIWIADCSGSMSIDGKIQALNNAIREALPHMRSVADENPNAEVLVRALTFSSGAQWHVSQPTPIADFKWTDLTADGVTDMGHALTLLAEQLRIPPMSDRALPPVLVLISDGQPTDDFNHGLQMLMHEAWGKKQCASPLPSVRMPIPRFCKNSSVILNSSRCRPIIPRHWCGISNGSRPPCSNPPRRQPVRSAASAPAVSMSQSPRHRPQPAARSLPMMSGDGHAPAGLADIDRQRARRSARTLRCAESGCDPRCHA